MPLRSPRSVGSPKASRLERIEAFMNVEPPEGPVTRMPAGMPMSASATESPVSSSDLQTTSVTMDESPRNMNHETSRRATMFQCAPSAPMAPGVHSPMSSASINSAGREK